MTPAQMAENPVQGEFFTAAADMPERLVREAIQNSMDAAMPGEVVRVRFAFSGESQALQPRRARTYLDGLERHLRAVAYSKSSAAGREVNETSAIFQAAGLLDQPLEWLVVEDFGTSGLTGDILANGANEPGNNFWGFFRQIGITTKSEDDAGSWGLGKWVFPDASRTNTFLALTRRVYERDSLLMGLAILKTHELDGRRFPAYGHFAAADEADDSHWFQMPITGSEMQEFIGNTARDFQLERTTESGVSVVVLWPKEELTPASLARAVITQYFLPILRNRLEVIIQHPAKEDRIIDAEHIIEELEWIDRSERDDESEESLRGLLELVEWAEQQDPDSGYISIDLPSSRWNPLRDEGLALNVEALRELYQRGERLAFELVTYVQPADSFTPEQTSCYLYLQRTEELEQGHDYFVRGNLRIPKVDYLRSQKARSLLLVDGDSPLGHLLRDAEGPAHTEWDPNAARVKENWARGAKSRVDDVRRAPLRLVQALVERPVERELDALADLFPADIVSHSNAAERDNSGSMSRGPEPQAPTTQPSPVRLTKASGGFQVSHNPAFPLTIAGTTWRVRFAYTTARGSKKRAFSQFDRGVKENCPDFSLRDGLNVLLSGCQAQSITDNTLAVDVEADEFQVDVSGFDPNRDLLVEVDLIEEPGHPDAEEEKVSSNVASV